MVYSPILVVTQLHASIKTSEMYIKNGEFSLLKLFHNKNKMGGGPLLTQACQLPPEGGGCGRIRWRRGRKLTLVSSCLQVFGYKQISSSHINSPKVIDTGGCGQGFQPPFCLTPNPKISSLYQITSALTSPHCTEMHLFPRTHGEVQPPHHI